MFTLCNCFLHPLLMHVGLCVAFMILVVSYHHCVNNVKCIDLLTGICARVKGAVHFPQDSSGGAGMNKVTGLFSLVYSLH